MRLLLVVTDRFQVAGRGVILAPGIDPGEAPTGSLRVELRLPDGRRRAATGHAQVPMSNPPPVSPRAMLLLVDAGRDDVPVGTEIWLDE